MPAMKTLRNVLFWLSCLLIALMSYRIFVLSFETAMPTMVQHLPRPVALYGHIVFAPIALALLPFQFWKEMRQRRPHLHRWLGRVYAMSILISVTAAMWLALTTQSGTIAAWGFGVLAVVWLVVTARAVHLAMTRQYAAHERWMIRSAALTFAAVTLRLQLPVGALTVGLDASYQVIAWSCWVPNLIFAEWWLRRKHSTRAAVQ